jgi:hypothetical protein
MNHKVIIVSKNEAEGTSKSDVRNPLFVTEIATELVITRLFLFCLLSDSKINVNDVIVTVPERTCLYTKIFSNVITWNEFKQNFSNYKNHQIIDLLEQNTFEALSGGEVQNRILPYYPFYRNWERDKYLIQNVDYSDIQKYNIEDNFVSLVIRTRSSWDEKNLPKKYWDDLIDEFHKNKIKVFVFGKETEIYENEHSNVKHVINFQDWCGIVNNSKCRSVISTITGGVYPSLIFGHDKITLTIIDNLDLVKVYGYDPSWYNDCINFSKLKKRIITKIPDIHNLVKDVILDLQ